MVFDSREREEMKYNSGPPPSIGWWPTSPHVVRWWDGENWSWACLDTDSLHWVKYFSAKIDPKQKDICWAERPDEWPERSRT
jgi:hypothetical protein